MDKLFRSTHRLYEDADESEGWLSVPLNMLCDAISLIPDFINHDYDRLRRNHRMDIKFNGVDIECNIPAGNKVPFDADNLEALMSAGTPVTDHTQNDGFEHLPRLGRVHTDQEIQDYQAQSALVEQLLGSRKLEQLRSPIPLVSRANPNNPYNYKTYKPPSARLVSCEENNNEPDKQNEHPGSSYIKKLVENPTEDGCENKTHPLHKVGCQKYPLSPHVVDRPNSPSYPMNISVDELFSVAETGNQPSSVSLPGNQLVSDDSSRYQFTAMPMQGYQPSSASTSGKPLSSAGVSENEFSSASASENEVSSASPSENQFSSDSASGNEFSSASTSGDELPSASTSENQSSSVERAYRYHKAKAKQSRYYTHYGGNRNTSPAPKKNTWPNRNSQQCGYCRNRGLPQDFYETHRVKRPDGTIECPILRIQFCPICKATGDWAHNRNHCPQNPNRMMYQQ